MSDYDCFSIFKNLKRVSAEPNLEELCDNISDVRVFGERVVMIDEHGEIQVKDLPCVEKDP